jgi:hypothetical protein
MTQIWVLRSRLEKQPTDLRQYDARLEQRMDAYTRGVEAGGVLARGIPTIKFRAGYVRGILAMLNIAVEGLGTYPRGKPPSLPP